MLRSLARAQKTLISMIKVAIAGDFQDGKSTLINALCGCDCAETGYGLATTQEIQEYRLPGTGITLIDTPGFNATREGDAGQACLGIERADACLFMLSSQQFTDRMFQDIRDALALQGGGYKPFIPLINDRGRNNQAIAQASVASMRLCGLQPILFGEEMPVIHARAWQKGRLDDEEYEQGTRRLQYLLGIHPRQQVSPLERICILHTGVLTLNKL